MGIESISRAPYLLKLLAVLVAGVLIFFVYRTQAPPAKPAAELMPTTEFGEVSLKVDYATSTSAQERGLSGRANVSDNYGMLFVFAKDGRYGIWMKDMLVPIDIFWLDANGHVVFIEEGVATSTYPSVFYPSTPARYVLETIAGFARAHDIKIGSVLQLKNSPNISQ